MIEEKLKKEFRPFYKASDGLSIKYCEIKESDLNRLIEELLLIAFNAGIGCELGENPCFNEWFKNISK